MIAALVDYLLHGSRELRLSRDWLREKMPQHEQWTRSQQQPGMARIVAHADEMARRQFWEAVAAKRQPRGYNVAEFKRQSER